MDLANMEPRARWLANSGHFKTVEEIVEAMRWEGWERPERLLRTIFLKLALRNLMADACIRARRRFDA